MRPAAIGAGHASPTSALESESRRIRAKEAPNARANAMIELARRAGLRLRRWAEHVAAVMLAVMFVAFMVQITFRYAFNFPIGWTSELTITMWLWVVLWGAAFVLREREEIRFDLIYAGVGRRVRRGFAIITAVALIALYGISLPASYDYVAFMKVQYTPYLHIRNDYFYSIFVIFAVAVIARYVWILWQAIRRPDWDSTASDAGPMP